LGNQRDEDALTRVKASFSYDGLYGLNSHFKRRDNVTIFGWRAGQRAPHSPVRLNLEPLGERILPSFTTPTTYAVNGNAHAVAVGDFTERGVLDLATANGGFDGASVLLGNGDGTYQPAVSYATGFDPIGILTADLRGIGVQDLITENQDSVSLLLGNGDGTFGPPTNLQTGAFPTVVVGDFTGSGTADLAVMNEFGTSVNVWLGNGDGTFQAPIASPAGNAVALVTADFNGDGSLDLAYVGGGQLHVMLGNGDGTFQAPADHAVGTDPQAVVAGDFTGSGIPDLAVANFVGHSVEVLLGAGDGTFADPQTYTTDQRFYAIATADFNQDGAADLLVGTYSTNEAGVMLGNGNGTFQDVQFFDAGNNTSSLAVANLKGDTYPDVAAAGIFTGTVSVVLNDGQWSGPATVNPRISSGQGTEAGPFTVAQAQPSDLRPDAGQVALDQVFATREGRPSIPSDSADQAALAHLPGQNTDGILIGDGCLVIGS
jgi:hypothetical protein